jgi:hypothetical protein
MAKAGKYYQQVQVLLSIDLMAKLLIDARFEFLAYHDDEYIH